MDQNCDQQDLVDVDGDRYPGISQADWEALPEHSSGVTWPTGLLSNDDPAYTAIDCNDEDNTIFPASGAAVPYDGVNTACNVNTAEHPWDDWDDDGDGHVPYANLYVGAPYTGSLPQDDCDDSNATVYPGTSVADVWYDGIDQDCDGADDFDQDGDGYIQDQYITAYGVFLDRYKYTDDRACTASDGSCNDCDDDPTDDGGQPVTAAQIHPGATETWYDGVDQNCAGDDDFDQDADGFECDGFRNVSCVGHTGTDCVDDDSAINPSALELLGDSADSDCVAGPDGANFATGPYSWTAPGRPAISANDQHYLLGLTALAFDDRGTPRDEPGVVFTLPVGTAIPSTLPTQELLEDKDPVSDTVALLPDSLDFWFGTTISDTDTSGNAIDSRMRLHHPEWSPPLNDYYKRLSTNVADKTITTNNLCGGFACPFNDFDLQTQDVTSDTIVWLVGCATGAVHYMQAHRTGTPTHIEVLDTASLATGVGQSCYLEINPSNANQATLHAYSDDPEWGVDHEFTIDTQASPPIVEVSTPSDPTMTWNVQDVHHHPGDLVVFAGGPSGNAPTGVSLRDAGTTRTAMAFNALRTYSADAVNQGGVWYVAAVVADQGSDGIDDLLFAHGSDLTNLSTPVQLPLPNDANPKAVALYADGDRVILTATGDGTGDDVFAWAMWGYAP